MKTEDKFKDKAMGGHKLLFILLGWPVFLPFVMLALTLAGLFFIMGWFFVSTIFFTSAFTAVLGVFNFLGVYANRNNGISPVLILFGNGLIALGLAAPIFLMALEFAKGFIVLTRAMLFKLKEICLKKGLK
jgi:lipopolysaccharide export LptBFGC system permease protein LptF